MRVRGALADYDVDYRAATTYLMLESNGLPYWRDDNLFIAFESYSGVYPNKYGTGAAHLILRVKTDLMFALWERLVPTYATKWLSKTADSVVMANVAQFIRAACLLLRRGFQPIDVTIAQPTSGFLVTEAEENIIRNEWNMHVDMHGAMGAALLNDLSKGAISVFEEGYGALEEKGERWVPYIDACIASVCGAPFYDLVAEYAGQPPDVVREVLHAVKNSLVDVVRIGASLGLSDATMQIPFIGQLDVSTFFSRHAVVNSTKYRHKSAVVFTPDPFLRKAIENVLNIVQPFPAEFGVRRQMGIYTKKVEAHGSEEIDIEGIEQAEDTRRVVFIREHTDAGAGEDATDEDATDEDESCANSESLYSDGCDPWDETDYGTAEEDGESWPVVGYA